MLSPSLNSSIYSELRCVSAETFCAVVSLVEPFGVLP